MIMVVALLVLLALIGTAHLASTRIDRSSSVQNTTNVQVDLLLESAIKMVKSAVVDDLASPVSDGRQPPNTPAGPSAVMDFRPLSPLVVKPINPANLVLPNIVPTDSIYQHITSTYKPRPPGSNAALANNNPTNEIDKLDWWLADRTPFPILDPTNPTGLPIYVWGQISDPFTTNIYANNSSSYVHRALFEDPTVDQLSTQNFPYTYEDLTKSYDPFSTNLSVGTYRWPVSFSHEYYMEPSGVNVSVNGTTRTYPCFYFRDPATNQRALENGRQIVRVAADTDGDGIADAGLIRMPVPPVNGVTYYMAVRVIDNAAAINAAIAWQKPSDQAGGLSQADSIEATGGRYFPTNISLSEVVYNTTARPEVDNFHYFYRSGDPNFTSIYNSQTAPNHADLNIPVADNGQNNQDFRFLSFHDALWMQLGRRLDNPGYIPNHNFKYHRAPISDMISLIRFFVLAPGAQYNSNPAIASGNGSILEQYMPFTLLARPVQLGNTIRRTPYAPTDANYNTYSWGPQNFDFFASGGNTDYSSRPLLVTSNAVSNAISPAYTNLKLPANDTGTPIAGVTNSDWNGDNIANDPITREMLPYFPVYKGLWNTSTQYYYGDIVSDNNGITYISCQRNQSQPQSGNDPTLPDTQYWEYQPFTRTPLKASLNTATFRELYRAYWSVLCDTGPGSQSDNNPDNPWGTTATIAPTSTNGYNPYSHTQWSTTPNLYRQFRTPVRTTQAPPYSSAAPYLEPQQVMLLRAALAAVNTIQLRSTTNDPNVLNDVVSRRIILPQANDPTKPQYEATVYGLRPQPFITEVYAHTDTATRATPGDMTTPFNPKGYVAVELYNPYNQDISLDGWKLGIIDRRRGTGTPGQLKLRQPTLFTFTAADRITANSHMVLENYNGGSGANSAALFRPAEVGNNVQNPKYIPNLHYVMEDVGGTEKGGELVLLRPRRTAAASSLTSQKPFDTYDENNDYDLIPVDQFDFTGLKLDSLADVDSVNGPTLTATKWHYVRRNGDGNRWNCVYPGRYDASKNPDEMRAEMEFATWTAPLQPQNSSGSAGEGAWQSSSGQPPTVIALGNDDPNATFASNFTPIQIFNLDFGGYNKITQTSNNAFPFGGFARVGDVMQVPFMGAYRLRQLNPLDPNGATLLNPPDVFVELNSLSMDCMYADDADSASSMPLPDDLLENIGRFCPIVAPATGVAINAGATPHYDFAKKVFDYLTVIAPHDDYFPNVNGDPTQDPNKNRTWAYRTESGGSYVNISPTATGAASPPLVVQNSRRALNVAAPEDDIGVEGLININTANWKVLAAVPWLDDGSTPTGQLTPSQKLALAIVIYRDFDDGTNQMPPRPGGPFRSLFDLYKVPGGTYTVPGYGQVMLDGFQQAQTNLISAAGNNPKQQDGDVAGRLNADDGVTGATGDFEHQFLLLNRVSNLLTTRSDSFTAYVVVQGWRNAGTPSAELVVQRRMAMFMDRTAVTKDRKELKTMLVPMD